MDSLSPATGSVPGQRATRAATDHRLAGAELEWDVDPIDLALLSVRDADGELPTALCVEVGRRLLLAEMDFRRWVLRRVETVSLGEGRSVSRKTSIEFKIRPDAPAFVTGRSTDGTAERLLLVPLTIMKRRTLVNFVMENEDQTPLTLPGLRLTQRLDESLLLAAAATAGPVGPEVREFARDVVAGDRLTTDAALERYDAGNYGEQLAALRNNTLFQMTLERLRYNFTLYVLLKEDRGRHRLLHMSFVEPISWTYQVPKLREAARHCWSYAPMNPVRRNRQYWASELGLVPTRVRFQTPAAEHAASYHLELVAPPGVRIVEATLLAGRPQVLDEPPTLDFESGDFLTVGLHGVDVPPNSLCRTQVLLRVQRAGWLTTLLITTLAIFLVLASVALHAQFQGDPDPDQDTNVVVLLVTTAAAAAAFLTQRDFSGVAARMLTGMRTVGAVAMALPILAAGFLSYKSAPPARSPLLPRLPEPADLSTKVAGWGLTAVALGLFLLVLTTWRRTRSAEKKDEVPSPWDQSRLVRPDRDKEKMRQKWNYLDAMKKYGFEEAAVGVRSSEGWHHAYRWTDADYAKGIDDLGALADGRRDELGYRCGDPTNCAHDGADGCPVRWRPSAGNFAVEHPPAGQPG